MHKFILILLLLLPVGADARLRFQETFDTPGDCGSTPEFESFHKTEGKRYFRKEKPPNPNILCGESSVDPSPQGGGYAEFSCNSDSVLRYVNSMSYEEVWVKFWISADPGPAQVEKDIFKMHGRAGHSQACADPEPALIWTSDPTDAVQFDVQTCANTRLPEDPTPAEVTAFEIILANHRTQHPAVYTKDTWHEVKLHFDPTIGRMEAYMPGSNFAGVCPSTDCTFVNGIPAGPTEHLIGGFQLKDVVGCDSLRIDDFRIYDEDPD